MPLAFLVWSFKHIEVCSESKESIFKMSLMLLVDLSKPLVSIRYAAMLLYLKKREKFGSTMLCCDWHWLILRGTSSTATSISLVKLVIDERWIPRHFDFLVCINQDFSCVLSTNKCKSEYRRTAEDVWLYSVDLLGTYSPTRTRGRLEY